MRSKAILLVVVLLVAGVVVGGAGAKIGPGSFTSASARAGSGFVVNATFAEGGLPAASTVAFSWSAHVVVGMACGGVSVSQNFGKLYGTLTSQANTAGTATGSFSVTLPALSCSNGKTAVPVKMMVRSIKVKDTTNHHRTKMIGWYISKNAKGFTSSHPFGG